jgi:hypothetical protein
VIREVKTFQVSGKDGQMNRSCMIRVLSLAVCCFVLGLAATAQAIHESAIIVDTHADTPQRFLDEGSSKLASACRTISSPQRNYYLEPRSTYAWNIWDVNGGSRSAGILCG